MNWILGYLIVGVLWFASSIFSGVLSDFKAEMGIAYTIGVAIQLLFLWPLTLFDTLVYLIKKR